MEENVRSAAQDQEESICVFVSDQHPSQPALVHLLPGCGLRGQSPVGLRLEQAAELQRHVGEGAAPSGSVLQHRDLAAQQVNTRSDESQTRDPHEAQSSSVSPSSCRYLHYTLDPEKIRYMDVPNVIMLIALNPAGQALAWNFLRANWEFLSKR